MTLGPHELPGDARHPPDEAGRATAAGGVTLGHLALDGHRSNFMEAQEPGRIAAALAHRAGVGANAAQMADAIVLAWRAIEAALGPVVGKGGVAALYKRSLYLTDPAHPWLAGLHEGVQPELDLAALKVLLAQQASAATAAAGGGAVLDKFHELLATLVGPSLTERLLRAVWEDIFNIPPARDLSP